MVALNHWEQNNARNGLNSRFALFHDDPMQSQGGDFVQEKIIHRLLHTNCVLIMLFFMNVTLVILLDPKDTSISVLINSE